MAWMTLSQTGIKLGLNNTKWRNLPVTHPTVLQVEITNAGQWIITTCDRARRESATYPQIQVKHLITKFHNERTQTKFNHTHNTHQQYYIKQSIPLFHTQITQLPKSCTYPRNPGRLSIRWNQSPEKMCELCAMVVKLGAAAKMVQRYGSIIAILTSSHRLIRCMSTKATFDGRTETSKGVWIGKQITPTIPQACNCM